MKRKILIVEDNISLSQMQKDWFAQAGYDVVTAMNEPIARSLIRKTAFDLILSDVRLPEGDGISLLEWLRKEKKKIPFIITTEYVSVPDVVRHINGCDRLSAQTGTQGTSAGIGRRCVPAYGHCTGEGEGSVSSDKPENSEGREVLKTGGSVRNGCNDTRCQRNRQGIGGTVYSSGQ